MPSIAKSSTHRIKSNAVRKNAAPTVELPDKNRSSHMAMWLVNGRLVSRSLHDPEIKKELKVMLTEQRKDVDALKDFYIANGFLTAGGKLAKRYGG